MKNYIIIIISALSLGIANAFYKKSTASIGPINTTFYYYIFGTIFSLIIWLVLKEPVKVEFRQMIHPILIAVFLCLSIVTFNVGLQNTKLSLSSTIRSFSFVFSVIIAVIFLKESLSIKQLFGIVLAFASFFLLVY